MSWVAMLGFALTRTGRFLGLAHEMCGTNDFFISEGGSNVANN